MSGQRALSLLTVAQEVVFDKVRRSDPAQGAVSVGIRMIANSTGHGLCWSVRLFFSRGVSLFFSCLLGRCRESWALCYLIPFRKDVIPHVLRLCSAPWHVLTKHCTLPVSTALEEYC